MSKGKLGKEGRGVGQRAMRQQEKRVKTDRADYQLNQAAKDFVSLNPGLDCNDPENLERAWKNFVGNFSPNDPSQKLRKFVFTPTLSSTNSRTLRVFLLALIAANMVTAVNAEIFQESLGRNLIGGEDSVPTPKSSAPLPPPVPARVRGGNLRGTTSVAAPEPPSTEVPARELAPTITQYQLESYINSQRDPTDPSKIISLAPLLAAGYKVDRDGLLILPSLRGGISLEEKLPCHHVDWGSAKINQFNYNVDFTGGVAQGKKLGSVEFDNCELEKMDFSDTTGRIDIKGSIYGSTAGVKFDGAKLRLRVMAGAGDFTNSTFERAELDGHVTDPSKVNSGTSVPVRVVGLDLDGAAVTVSTNPANPAAAGTETVTAVNPLVIKADDPVLSVAAVPGFALRTGPVELTIESDTEKCSDYISNSSAISPATVEEFADAFKERFSIYNIAVTTNSSETGPGIKSKFNLCQYDGVGGATSNAQVFPQLQTQIAFDRTLPLQAAKIKAVEEIGRALGMTPEASQILNPTCIMRTADGRILPTPDPEYSPVMMCQYIEALVGMDPKLAGCVSVVGLEKGKFKVVAGDVDLVIDPEFCGENSKFTCSFNQKASLTCNGGRVQALQIPDMAVSLNMIEDEDENPVGYAIAVNGMKKVAGTAVEDEMHCPPPSPPVSPTSGSVELGSIGIAAFSVIGAVSLYCCAAMAAKSCGDRNRRVVTAQVAPEIEMVPIIAKPAQELAGALHDRGQRVAAMNPLPPERGIMDVTLPGGEVIGATVTDLVPPAGRTK